MDVVVLGTFAFLAGLTGCGIAASIFELALRRPVSFCEPFVSADHIPRSIAVAVLAGPFMLGNDALDARRAGAISRAALAACAAGAAFWLVAVGIMLLTLASGAAGLFQVGA